MGCRAGYWSLALTLYLVGSVRVFSAEVLSLKIENPQHYWKENYISLTPAIHPPTTHDRGDLITAWLKLPEKGRIDVRWLEDQQRYTLTYPDGTVADRVEYFYLGEAAPLLADYAPFTSAEKDASAGAWTVADVRGTRLVDGRQWFHVYRPASGEPHAALTGWRWPRGDPSAQRKATQQLLEHASHTPDALADSPSSPSGLAALRRLNDCASCHQPDQPKIRTGDNDRTVERATDALGFITPNAVLRDECVLADHRPEDINTEDKFVTVLCADNQPARLHEGSAGESFVCDDGSAPRGRRDIASGLAAGHDYTQAVCLSRQALYRRMTKRARTAFAQAFAVCGISGSLPAEKTLIDKGSAKHRKHKDNGTGVEGR